MCCNRSGVEGERAREVSLRGKGEGEGGWSNAVGRCCMIGRLVTPIWGSHADDLFQGRATGLGILSGVLLFFVLALLTI